MHHCKNQKHPFDSSHVFAEEVQGKLPEEILKFIRQREKNLLKNIIDFVEYESGKTGRREILEYLKELSNE